MAKKKIGLALGAGSARGFAHIGVIRALKENNIPIDCISGTSMGAIIGSFYACGTDLERLPGFFKALDDKQFFDYTTSRKGMIAGKRFEELIKMFTKEMNFEELDLPFVCVACDIIKGESHTFNYGPIYKAVRCSMSIPGMITPYEYLNTVFVDGAVLERVPIDACKTFNPDIVIGVDVGYAGTEKTKPRTFLETLLSASDIMSWEITKKQILKADHMIMPNVRDVTPYRLKDIDICIQAGYDEAIKQMKDIKELIK